MEIENLKLEVFLNAFIRFLYIWESPTNRGNFGRFFEKSKCLKKKKEKKIYHFTSALFSKDMLKIVKGFAPWIYLIVLKKSFYIRWSAGRSPWVHEVNPGRDPSLFFLLRWESPVQSPGNLERRWSFSH